MVYDDFCEYNNNSQTLLITNEMSAPRAWEELRVIIEMTINVNAMRKRH